jgi:bifunctional ADP-heptose synthase (sugar kinase/adenylyltransferase)
MQLYSDAGMLPEMPQELVEAFGEFEPRYTSPIANAQKSDEAIGARNTVMAAIELAQAGNTDALKRINGSEYIALIASANSTPGSVILSDEEFAGLQQAEQEQQEQQMLLENAQQLSQAGKNVVETQGMMEG